MEEDVSTISNTR